MFNSLDKITAFIIVQSVFEAVVYSLSCDSSDSRSLGISVFSKKNDFGKWTDSFHARAEHSNSLSNVFVDVLHNVTECSGRRIINIQGFIRDGNSTNSDQEISANTVLPIVFHSKHGSNVVVSNNGRTIEKKNLKEDIFGTAFTNRPLKNDELFEVRLDQKGSRRTSLIFVLLSFGIGILTKNPNDIEIPKAMLYSKYAWMYYHNSIFNDDKRMRSSYGPSLDPLPVGTKFGVMKKASGDIHFFINQVDQGSAISGISDPVYGIVELWFNAEKVTILAP